MDTDGQNHAWDYCNEAVSLRPGTFLTRPIRDCGVVHIYMFSLVQLNTIYLIHELIKIIFYSITGCVPILIDTFST